MIFFKFAIVNISAGKILFIGTLSIYALVDFYIFGNDVFLLVGLERTKGSVVSILLIF